MFGPRVGTITGRGSRERLVSAMHKIAKNGDTIEADPALGIEIPAPNIWWDPDDLAREIEEELKREAE